MLFERDRQVQQVVQEQVGEHRVARPLQHDHRVVVHRTAPVGGEPVADHVDVDALGHVGGRGGHVTGPGAGDPGLAGRDVGVVGLRDPQVHQRAEVLQGLPRQGDLLVVRGVQVEDAVLHQAQADALAVVVEDRDPAPVLGLPRHRPRVLHRVRVLVHQVLTPGDPGRVDRVRDRVLPALVVEGIGVIRPGLADVRDVGVVQRLGELALDDLAEHVGRGPDEHVEGQAAAQLGQRLVHRVERRELHLALVLLGEAVHDVLVDIRLPDVNLERRVPLGPDPGLDRGVAREYRPFDRVTWPRQRQLSRAGQVGGAARQRAGLAAERRERRQARTALEEAAARHAVSLPAFTRMYQPAASPGLKERCLSNAVADQAAVD